MESIWSFIWTHSAHPFGMLLFGKYLPALWNSCTVVLEKINAEITFYSTSSYAALNQSWGAKESLLVVSRSFLHHTVPKVCFLSKNSTFNLRLIDSHWGHLRPQFWNRNRLKSKKKLLDKRSCFGTVCYNGSNNAVIAEYFFITSTFQMVIHIRIPSIWHPMYSAERL